MDALPIGDFMNSLRNILAVTLLTLSGFAAHAEHHFCIDNTIDESIDYSVAADVTFTREMDPVRFADLVRTVKTYDPSIDESNPQWHADDDFWLQYENNRVIITSISGNVARGSGTVISGNISKHTKQCFTISDHDFNLPFNYSQGRPNLNIHVNSTGQSFGTTDIDNMTVIVHGTPFWWLDHSIPRYRIDTHSLSGRQ